MPYEATAKIGVQFSDATNSLAKEVTRQTPAAIQQLERQLRGANAGFGTLNSNVRQFDSQLERANKRVLALGASVTIIYGAVRAFGQLVRSTAEVEQNLASMNTIFQLSTKELDRFGKTLSGVALQTGQALSNVTKAAEEFARQGLGVEETAKRTRDAMILVRLTGLDVVKAVDTMTAALNTFGKVGVDSTTVINKLVAVDRAFAVSAKDLAEAFARVGSVVDDANVSFDQFNGLVTAARQITSRAGTVIGNSLKTIFTRLERSSTLDQLEAFGIGVRDASGNAKSAIEVFNALAASYRGLNREQQQQVTELAAGVFQINQFKALLLDLGKANGVAAQATRISTGATNEALIANAALNKTLATSLQNLQTSATTAAAVVGNLSVRPALDIGMGLVKTITDAIGSLSSQGGSDVGEDLGRYLGESLLKGLGKVLAGPGFIFAIKAATGLIGRTMSEATRDIRQASEFPRTFFSGIGTSSGLTTDMRAREAQSLQTVNGLLTQGTQKERERFAAATSVAEQEAIILGILQKQVATMGALGGSRAAPAVASLRGRSTPRAAGGYIPFSEESAAVSAGVGGAPASARPVYLPGFNRGGGQRGIVANTSEWMVPGAAGGSIYNRDMIRKYGLPAGATPVAAGGHVPNAAISYQSGDLKLGGSPFAPFNLPMEGLTKLNSLFGQLSRAANTLEAAKVGPQIVDLAKSLDKLSEKRVLGDLARVFNSLPTRSEGVQNAPIYMGGKGASGSIYVDPRADDVYDPMGRAIRRGIQVAGTQGGALQVTDPRGAASQGYFNRNRIDIAKGLMDPRTGGPTEAESKRIEADLARDQKIFRVREELRQQEERANARARLGRYAGNLQMASIGLSFASGFVPEGKGGTTEGKAYGALSAGMQGTAVGAGLGSLFGPWGTIVGALTTGLFGAVKGFVEKSRKSFDELAKELNEANAERQKMLAGASQFRNIQGNIQEAIQRGRGSEVINTLVRQQRTASTSLSPDLVRQLLSAAGNDEAMADIFEKMNAEAAEASASEGLRAGMKALEDPGRLGKEQMAGVAGALRGVTGDTGTGVRSLLNRIKIQGGLSVSTAGRSVGLEGPAPLDGGAFDPNEISEATVQAELIAIIKGATLTEAEKDAYIANVKASKGKTLVSFLEAFQKAGDTGPLIRSQEAGNIQLAGFRTQYADMLRLRSREEALGAVGGQFGASLSSMRERAATGLGGLTETGGQTLAAQFALRAAQRNAVLSNTGAFQATRERFAQTATGLGYDAKKLLGVEGADSIEAFQKIADAAFGNDLKAKLNDVVTELRVTVAQNDNMIALTKEDNRLNQLQLEAQQQQRLLAAGTLSGATGSTARSLFSRFQNTRGAANAVNAVNLSGFLNQIGLPQTEEGEAFEKGARASSVRDTIAEVLSARLGRRVGAADVESANEELSRSSRYGDTMLSGRIGEGLNRLKMDVEGERQKLISGGTAGEDTLRGLSTGILVLRSPLEEISKATQATLQVQQDIRDNLAAQAKVGEMQKLEVERVVLQQQISSGRFGATEVQAKRARVEDISGQMDILSDELYYPERVEEAVSKATAAGVAKGMSEAGITNGVVLSNFRRPGNQPHMVLGKEGEPYDEKTNAVVLSNFRRPGNQPHITLDKDGKEIGGDKVTTLPPYKVPMGKGAGGGLFGFGTGFTNSLDQAVKEGRFTTIEEAMRSLESVGERVGASLEQNLGNAFGDFVTGAQKGKDAFRAFVLGVLNDSARAMASKAVQQLLGYVLTTFLSKGVSAPASGAVDVPVGTSATGGYIGMAGGGRVPTLLTGGEYVFGAPAAKRLGSSVLTGLNTGTVRKMAGGGSLVRGGSGLRDDVPALLAPGSFVVRKAMTERYGAPFLSGLAGGGATASFSSGDALGGGATVTMTTAPMQPMRMADGGTVTSSVMGGGYGGGTFNIGVSISDNRTSSSSSSQPNGGGAASLADRQFGESLAARMKQVAVQAIEEQTRMGGMLRRQSLRST